MLSCDLLQVKEITDCDITFFLWISLSLIMRNERKSIMGEHCALKDYLPPRAKRTNLQSSHRFSVLIGTCVHMPNTNLHSWYNGK